MTKPVCAMTHRELADFIVGAWLEARPDIDRTMAEGVQAIFTRDEELPADVTEGWGKLDWADAWHRFPELSTDELAAAFRRARKPEPRLTPDAAAKLEEYREFAGGDQWTPDQQAELAARGHHLNMNDPPFRPCPVCGDIAHTPNCTLNQPTEGRDHG